MTLPAKIRPGIRFSHGFTQMNADLKRNFGVGDRVLTLECGGKRQRDTALDIALLQGAILLPTQNRGLHPGY
jgi:hypothetical protein